MYNHPVCSANYWWDVMAEQALIGRELDDFAAYLHS
jgi:hypothetical protein